MTDGLAVNIPRIAVTTGQIDAMECVLEKMGLAHAEFANPGGARARPPLPRRADDGDAARDGARIDDMTPHADALYGDLPARCLGYDLVVADCEGRDWDENFTERDASGCNVRDFVNRGGRMFASHLSLQLAPRERHGSVRWTRDRAHHGSRPGGDLATTADTNPNDGTGLISVGRPSASPRIQNFADWMVNEGVTTAPGYDFTIIEPRSQNTGLGPSFRGVRLSRGRQRCACSSSRSTRRTELPQAAACGRVAYSGFHVSAGGGSDPFQDVVFPAHCTGDLTAQEKVLLYMLFDLGACIGDFPPPPPCVPETC